MGWRHRGSSCRYRRALLLRHMHSTPVAAALRLYSCCPTPLQLLPYASAAAALRLYSCCPTPLQLMPYASTADALRLHALRLHDGMAAE
jgi:hypothetical protein